MKPSFVVTDGGVTLAAALRKNTPDMPWSRARSLCERGKVFVDGAAVTDSASRVRAGQSIVIDEHAPAPPSPLLRALVYEDPHVIIIDKPEGISSVPYEKRDTGTAMDLIRDVWRAQGRKATQTPLLVVHRIDKDTSGLLCFAKTKEAERGLARLFRTHDVERTYLCVAHGAVKSGRIESRFVEDRGDGLRGSTRRPGQGKTAVTLVTAKEKLNGATLCEVRLETGKTHQIRIHLAERGHPLVGERVYIRDYQGELIESPRLLLHAATLGFVHPVDQKKISFSSELPASFTVELDKLR
jgi:23S rRNA pseudouridine1911/1915/1917 synthase